MANAFEETWLWRSAFGDNEDPIVSAEERVFFRQRLLDMRERVIPLVARIARDMPGYTVHDITHLDALWETASLVAKTNLKLNPPEAFVFGGAVLLHDAAMTLAAYPGGLAELKKTTKWADIAAISAGRSGGKISSDTELRLKVEVLRQLHAERAEELPIQNWPTDSEPGQPVYLIDHPELRGFYGRTMGLIAHSHWWPISKVERELSKFLGALPAYTRSEVDLLKVAALLRVADVIHLDHRRAPFFWRTLEQPTGVSALHWKFQKRMAFPRLDGEELVFTAGEPFPLDDADPWWLAFDTLAMADRELADADRVLRDNRRLGFAARRVSGVANPSEMVRHIPVSGWRPVDTRLRVSDIPRIVQTFGGEQLYGDDETVSVRELVQNAIDAVQARRRIEGRGPDWGVITVGLFERDNSVWLFVEDTGVGMSEAVLTGSLLDFGTSFWGTARMVEEFPGLAAKGMAPLGRFGVGFFSVFMLGEHVRVITRQINRARADASLLEFKNGLNSRPILSNPSNDEIPVDGGTRVEIRLRRDPRVRQGIALREPPKIGFDLPFGRKSIFPSLLDLVQWIAPAAPISIDASDFGESARAVSANDWLTIDVAALLSRVSKLNSSAYRNMVRIIRNDSGEVVGRGAFHANYLYSGQLGIVVAGGLRVMERREWAGILVGDVSKIDRAAGDTQLTERATREFINDQVLSSNLLTLTIKKRQGLPS